MKVAPKGKGLQKRKRLLAALVELWDATPSSDEEELPVAMKRAIYKAMAGVLTPKQVAIELGVLAKAGLVTVTGDGVRCSEVRVGAGAAAARPRDGARAGAGATTRAGEGSGGEAEGSTEARGRAAMAGGRGGVGEDGAGRQTLARDGKRRRAVTEYVESEQGSEESDAGDWD